MKHENIIIFVVCGDFGVHKHNECKSANNVPVLCLLKQKSIVFPLCIWL